MTAALPIGPVPEQRLRLRLHPVPQSAGIARTFVAHHLTALGYPELVDNGCLIASELVTNALRTTPGRQVRLYLSDNGGRPLLEIQDACPDPPIAETADVLDESGRGLSIVDALAAMCGHRPLDQGRKGKIVWALLK